MSAPEGAGSDASPLSAATGVISSRIRCPRCRASNCTRACSRIRPSAAAVDAVDAGSCRQRQRRQRRQRLDAPAGQPPPLVNGDAGHQRQMVDLAPVRPAVPLPVAELAVPDRLRLRLRRRVDVRLEALADDAVVRGVFRDPEAFEPAAVPAERQMHPLRRCSLHLPQQIRVEQQLQQRLAPGDPGELGVDHLVRPGAKCARRFHPQQEIGVAAPAAFLQAALVDHVRAAPHRVRGAREGRITVVAAAVRARCRDRLDGEPSVDVHGQQPLFVLDPAPAQQLGPGSSICGARWRRPSATARRRFVRCPQARKRLRSVAEKVSWPRSWRIRIPHNTRRCTRIFLTRISERGRLMPPLPDAVSRFGSGASGQHCGSGR